MANVLDFTCETYPDDLLEDIFRHQHALAEKYIPIETKNGLCLYDTLPADIDNAKAQARIKDMSWRAVEEVAEAFEALGKGEIVHFYEEMADALHFLVEKYLLCDFFPIEPGVCRNYFNHNSDLTSNLGSFFKKNNSELEDHMLSDETLILLRMHMSNFIIDCGLTCNCLKNKPWKQSQMMTDEKRFRTLLNHEFKSFMTLCNVAGFSPRSLYDMYIRKNQVNQFRQRSNY